MMTIGTQRATRRAILWTVGGAAAALATRAGAQTSERTTKIVVGFPAGGGLDAMSRIIADKLREQTGQPAIVENKPGAAGRIAAEAVVRSEPDGSTLLSAPIVATAFYPFIFKSLPFDPLVDLAPISRFCTFQFALAVNTKLPTASLADFLAYARANKERMNFGSLGAGTPSHFLGVMLNQAAGIEMAHVPYRGSAPALTDLLGGTIQATFDTTASLMEQYKAGTIRLLAITGASRSPRLPDVPTFAELKLGLGAIESADFWYGFFAAGKTPEPILDKLNGNLRSVLADPAVRRLLSALDVGVVADTRAEFSAIIKADYDRWGGVIRSTGFTLE
ncbi:Bug family tripartite tricarboxylate transporter substrate binding protein [Bradyrhizobium sp. DOA9]|uniref:Bug family tripartite tricarboxylate transporter substrate binding protein n=1 Tax=Bradyrhizobium sp. DOA9 TaxID=1126627 RepID=UPI000467FAA8|nr:tripartite tricarboxylate transporter substrate binding protein [Bradyrhizobium sp. DOA9]